MNVEVRLFAAMRQSADRDALCVELPRGAKVGDLRRELIERHPQLAYLLRHSSFAVGGDYANEEQELAEGADVACIPPVSGG